VVYARTIDVSREPGEVFDYLADFSNAAEWDPGIVESRRLTPAPTEVGSRFEVVASFRGEEQRFEYAVTALEPGRRIVLHGEGAQAVSDDTITISPAEDGTRVAYRADIRLKGLRRIAEPFLRGTLTRMGADALAGLETVFSAGTAAR
jgi:carbon monoxide dehydrogenase subunit G